MPLTSDPFLSMVLERPVFKYLLETGAHSARGLGDLPEGGMVFARVPTADVAGLTKLVDAGFRVVDVTLTLEADATVLQQASATHARPARPEDRGAVVEIARTAFQFSRFHLDPRIPKVLADRSREVWTDNFFAGSYGDFMTVADDGSGPSGYLLGLGPKDGVAVISLMAVSTAARGQGLGRATVAAAARLPGVTKIRVGTQGANVGAMHFYEDLGFRTVATEYACHLHA